MRVKCFFRDVSMHIEGTKEEKLGEDPNVHVTRVEVTVA